MKEHHWQWIFEVINDIDRVQPIGLLLKRSGHGKIDSFILEFNNESLFHDSVKNKLSKMKKEFEDKNIRIIEGFDESDDDSVTNILDASQYNSVKNTINSVLQTSAANNPNSLKRIEGVKISATLFEIPDHNLIIVFDQVSAIIESSKKVKLVATYDNGLQRLKKPVLAFNVGLPCIYFQKTDKLVVFNMKKTEEIFNLLEHYQKTIIEKFDELANKGIIDMDPEIVKSQTKNSATARRTYSLIKGDTFTTNIEDYIKYDEYFDKHNIDESSATLKLKNNKIIIKTKEQFNSFLDLAGYNFVVSVINEDKKFIASRKREVKTKSITKEIKL